MFKHILVPTDGSPLSERAVHGAIALAKENGARITALFAEPEFHAYFVEGLAIDATVWQKTADLVEAETTKVLGFVEEACKAANVPCTKLAIRTLVPYEAIIDAAEKGGCDLIFMASHGRRGLNALLLGSETVKVLTHSTIPVLVYR